eukprot:11277290-Ditylum_brightwellii.AAC.1
MPGENPVVWRKALPHLIPLFNGNTHCVIDAKHFSMFRFMKEGETDSDNIAQRAEPPIKYKGYVKWWSFLKFSLLSFLILQYFIKV